MAHVLVEPNSTGRCVVLSFTVKVCSNVQLTVTQIRLRPVHSNLLSEQTTSGSETFLWSASQTLGGGQACGSIFILVLARRRELTARGIVRICLCVLLYMLLAMRLALVVQDCRRPLAAFQIWNPLGGGGVKTNGLTTTRPD